MGWVYAVVCRVIHPPLQLEPGPELELAQALVEEQRGSDAIYWDAVYLCHRRLRLEQSWQSVVLAYHLRVRWVVTHLSSLCPVHQSRQSLACILACTHTTLNSRQDIGTIYQPSSSMAP
jgi:hypothetical protein